MAFAIEFSAEARWDLEEYNRYYSAISEDLNTKFNSVIIEAVERISKNPQHFQKRYRDIKIVFTKTFPFGIHHLVEENTVYIQRILHQKRRYK